MFANPSVLEPEVPEFTASVAAAPADTGGSSSVALAPDAAAPEQLTLGQGGDVRGPVPSAASDAARGFSEILRLAWSRPQSRPHSRLQGRK